MKNITHWLLSLIAILLLVLSSCNNESPKKCKRSKKITIRDNVRGAIDLPSNINRVIPLYYVQAEIICAIGGEGKIVGIGKIDKKSSSLITALYSDILKLPQVGNQNNISFEKIISLAPDLIFTDTDEATLERFSTLHIPTIATYPNSLVEISQEIDFYGNILGKSKQAERLSTLFNDIIEKIKICSKQIPKKDILKVYYIRTDALTTLGGNTLPEIMGLAGGRLVTSGISNNSKSLQVSMEDVCLYNPDVIIIRDRASITPTDLYSDKRWKNIAAIQKHRVYQEHYGWTEFRLETVFGLIEKAKWLHPTVFKNINAEDEYHKFTTILKQNNE